MFHSVTPIYEELPGWSRDLSSFTTYDQLPPAARSYVAFLAEAIGVKISVVGVGPGREQFVTPL